MSEGKFKKQIKELELDDYPYGEGNPGEDFLEIVNEARKEYPTEESVIAKNPDYWRNLEGMPEYRTILRNNLDAERQQWFLEWFGSK